MKKQSQTKNLLLQNSILLAVAFLLAKVLGAFYRLPLTNILSMQGMGIYQMVFPMYAFMQVLLTSGISVATTKLVAKSQKGSLECKKIFASAIKLSIYVGLVLALLISLIGIFVGKYQQIKLGSYFYVLLSACLVASGAASTIKAYFQGKENMVPTALSALCEQLSKLVFGLILAKTFLKFGIEFGVLGALIGVFISELVVLCVNVIFFKKQKTIYFNGEKNEAQKLLTDAIDLNNNEPQFLNNPTKEIIKIALPVVFASSVVPLVFFIDSLLVVKLLTLLGVSLNNATNQYGLLYGVINSLINMPTVFACAVSLSLLPNLTRNTLDKALKSKMAIYASIAISLIFVCLFFVFPKSVLGFLYKNLDWQLSSNLLKISAILVVVLSVSMVLTSILQSEGKFWQNFVVLVCGAVLKYIALLICFLTKSFNIYVACYLNIGFYAFVTIVNLLRFNLLFKTLPSFKKILALAFMFLLMIGGSFAIEKFVHFNFVLNLLICGIYLSVIFVIFCYFMFKKNFKGKTQTTIQKKGISYEQNGICKHICKKK